MLTNFKDNLALWIALIIGACLGSSVFVSIVNLAANQYIDKPFLIYFLPLAAWVFSWLSQHQRVILSTESAYHLLMQWVGALVSHLFGVPVGREAGSIFCAGLGAKASIDILNRNNAGRWRFPDLPGLSQVTDTIGYTIALGTPWSAMAFALERHSIKKINWKLALNIIIAASVAWGVSFLLPHIPLPINFTSSHYFSPLLVFVWIAFTVGSLVLLFLYSQLRRLFAIGLNHLNQRWRLTIVGTLLSLTYFIFANKNWFGIGAPLISESYRELLPFELIPIRLLLLALATSAGFVGGEVVALAVIGALFASQFCALCPWLEVKLLSDQFIAVGTMLFFATRLKIPIAGLLTLIELAPNISLARDPLVAIPFILAKLYQATETAGVNIFRSHSRD